MNPGLLTRRFDPPAFDDGTVIVELAFYSDLLRRYLKTHGEAGKNYVLDLLRRLCTARTPLALNPHRPEQCHAVTEYGVVYDPAPRVVVCLSELRNPQAGRAAEL